MAQYLKRWESPRRRGRNDKGKGGAARRRQIKKQQKMLRKKLKGIEIAKQQHNKQGNDRGDIPFSPLFFAIPLRSICSWLFPIDPEWIGEGDVGSVGSVGGEEGKNYPLSMNPERSRRVAHCLFPTFDF